MSLSILSVGEGDIKLVFAKDNPTERIRSARIVRDLLRRGYALLVEVEQPDGSKAYQRALDFREDTAEYIIADFDPTAADSQAFIKTNDERDEHEEASEAAPDRATETGAEAKPARPRGRPRRTVAAETTRAVAVARTAGG